MISLFQNAQAVIPISEMSMEDFLNNIKYGKWKNEVETIRLEKDKEKRKALKEMLNAVSASATLSKRNQNNVTKHSGYICIDADGITDDGRLRKDPYVFAIFRSVSGNGLAIIVRINPEKHKESFRFLQKHFFDNYSITVDPAPQNVASLRFVSYDPDLFINEKSKTAKTLEEKKTKPQSLPMVANGASVNGLRPVI